MMSRFTNLEFGDESEERPAMLPLKDEAYYLAQARSAFEAADFEAGLRHYAKVLEFNPRNAAAWAGQVRMLVELGEYREARLWADKALERFPHEPELLAAKAVALGRSGDLQEALACSDAAVEERGDTPYVWLARADVLLARREPRADFCFEKALGMAAGDWFIAWLAARIRCFYEQFLLGQKLLQQAVELNGTHFVLWLELGRCQQSLGMVRPALTSFGRALELNPGCHQAGLARAKLANSALSERVRGWWRRLFS